MTVKNFQALVIHALSKQKEILHILESSNSFLVSCIDESSFFINVLESKSRFVHDEIDNGFASQYMETHSEEEFVQDVLDMANAHPGFFFYFMIFSKLEGMGIVDNGLFYHILDSIIYYENEFDEFMAKMLSHYSVEDNGEE